jgi:hypothetical protein
MNIFNALDFAYSYLRPVSSILCCLLYLAQLQAYNLTTLQFESA